MKQILIKTQKEFDKIKLDFNGDIIIKDTKEGLSINKSFDNAEIYVYGNATIESVYGNATIESVYGNATIESVSGNATIKSVSNNATIESVSGNATIKSVSGNATIESVYGNATIKSVSDNATIESVSGNATIKSVSDNATIESVSGNATIESVYGNATILLMTGLASLVLLYSAQKIIAKGMNIIRQIGDKKIDIEKGKDVTFIKIKETIENNTTFEFYKRLYPVDEKGKSVIMYKAVHKSENGEYYSNFDKNFKYRIGEIKEEKCSKSKDNSCSEGIHISHKLWAINFGRGWSDLAILECEVNDKDIVVSKDCDGKVRASKIKVLRELPKSEY